MAQVLCTSQKSFLSPCQQCQGIERNAKHALSSSAFMLLVGRQEGHLACKKLSGGAVMCLGQGADLHMAQLMPMPLTISCSSKSRLVLPS